MVLPRPTNPLPRDEELIVVVAVLSSAVMVVEDVTPLTVQQGGAWAAAAGASRMRQPVARYPLAQKLSASLPLQDAGPKWPRH
jgi:hypothetical protein